MSAPENNLKSQELDEKETQHFGPIGVNWVEQWELFAPNFQDGKAHIDLKGTSMQLFPGPGFGDFSHPTTQLMLEQLKTNLSNEPIVDIGTGSGILSIAALLLGASDAIGIDIDPEALIHAKKNGDLNQVGDRLKLSTELPKQIQRSIFLMNMILPEQKQVNPFQWNKSAKLWITSGILREQRDDYLKITKEWGWIPTLERTKDNWMVFVFGM